MNISFSETIKLCAKNGDRLQDDARSLLDCGSYASAYALSKLAQEEFAKGFILMLVESGGLKWTKEIRRSLNHHVSKQLMALILEYINPDYDVHFRDNFKNYPLRMPNNAADAINIYIHEIISRWESSTWCWAEDPEYDKEAKLIFDGNEERKKQDAIYIRINKDGQAIDSPAKITCQMAKQEFDKANRYRLFVSTKNSDFRYDEIIEILKMLKRAE